MSNPIATIEFKNRGKLKIELFSDITNTTNNFIELALSGFYNDIKMHRMVKDFVIQGGCPHGTGTGGAGYNIKGEFANNRVENNYQHKIGTISMARAIARDSASSQFFICTADMPHLDGEYAAFGQVIEGFELLNELNNLGTSSGEPLEEVIIKKIEIELFGKNPGIVEKI